MKLGHRSVVHQAVYREVCLHPAYVEGKSLVNCYAILLELYLSYSWLSSALPSLTCQVVIIDHYQPLVLRQSWESRGSSIWMSYCDQELIHAKVIAPYAWPNCLWGKEREIVSYKITIPSYIYQQVKTYQDYNTSGIVDKSRTCCMQWVLLITLIRNVSLSLWAFWCLLL